MTLPGAAEIDWRSVGWSGKVSPEPLVYVGTPGVSRKAVVHLVNPDSRSCEAIVKVPLTEAARAAILHEADVLEIIADEKYNRAPRLLYVDRNRGVATQTFIHGRAGGRRFSDGYGAALRSLMLVGERTTIVGQNLELLEQLVSADCGEAGRRTMTAAMRELTDAEPVPACWVHGDFAPWNIRRLPDGFVLLLDWEDAQRSGLPLQDAFHFFHMQDYLFGERPRTHAEGLLPLAKAVGLSAQQCRKLEIAYVVRFYLRRRGAGELEHCKYLLATLQAVLDQTQERLVPFTDFRAVESASVKGVTTSPIQARIRSELFSAVIAKLNSTGIDYCVLSGHERHAEDSSSDVDFMFRKEDMKRVAPLLLQAALSRGGRLIQAMHHETSACYFVLAKDDGSDVGYFDPDCTSDYRAHGRLWLRADLVLERRRRRENYYVPAVPDEFAYYLVKKVLKQSVAGFQLCRLRHLYQRDPVNCRAAVERFWPLATTRAIERALAGGDLAWFQSAMPVLLKELMASTPTESLWDRVKQGIRNGLRIAERALHSTGMSVLICGGTEEDRSTIASQLARQLAPGFRQVAKIEIGLAGGDSALQVLGLAGKVLIARVRSTLVVSSVIGRLSIPRLSLRAARILLRPELILAFMCDEAQMRRVAESERGRRFDAHMARVVYLDSRASADQNLRRATCAILSWMAARLDGRLSLNSKNAASQTTSCLMTMNPEPARGPEGAE